jgi:tetratricopeptide (TPR) repeat protein
LSWQVTVIGDPLYRPFGRLEPGGHIGVRFGALHQVLSAQGSPLLPWSVLQVANFRLAVGEPPASVLEALAEDPLTAGSSVLQEKLGDLYGAVGKLPSAIRAYERALRLETSLQQRTRVTLVLAHLLGLFTREREALDLYQGLLDEVKDYPAPLSIYQKMLPLARRLNEPEEIQRIETAIERLTPPSSAPAARDETSAG